jgi:hypothetical protein
MLTAMLIATYGLAPAGLQTKYRVSVKVSKPAALANAKTYTWTESHPSFNQGINAQIVAAVDRELQTQGLRKVATGPSDLVVTYASLSRTDVDVKSKAISGERTAYAVGTLIVELRDPRTHATLFQVRMDTPIDTDPQKLEAAINASVAAMFEQYPKPKR